MFKGNIGMIKLTSEILEKIEEEIETPQLLGAVGFLDEIRCLIGESEDLRPPQIREDLLQLHQLLFAPDEADGEKIFELTDNIASTLSAMIEYAEKILQILSPIQKSF